ncbi:MAG TPA: Ig-like domain-containing protein, partial [Pseudomonadales bacterium]|nr:Ig-like domain-containing protein [Pseudomonadales bacterium]
MKKSLIVSWVCAVMFCCNVFGQTANDYVASGLGNLANEDLVNANSNFLAALTLDTNNADANVLLAATRLLLAPQTPAGSNFLNGLNFPANGRDVYNWTSAPPKDAFGGPVFPANYNSTNVVYFYRTNIMLLVNASLINLGNVTDTSFLLTITNGDGLGQVTIDYGDVQMFRALLTAGNFLGYTLDANNVSFILPKIVGLADTNGLTLQQILSTYPSLLTPHNTNDLIPSENALESAATFYFTASDFIRNDRSPDDTNDLITLGPDEAGSEANFRTVLSNVVSSLSAPTQFDPSDPNSIVNLGPYLSGKTSVRTLVPQFNGNTYVHNSVPDYTFGGILPDEPPYKTEAFLRKSFSSPAGFYIGNVQDDNFSDPNAGIFEVFVGANNQIDIVGYDSDVAGGAAPGGFLVQATVDAQGDWQVSNSSVQGSGHVGQHGGFSGELDYANGDSIELFNSMEILPPGPFQGPSGYYTGTANASGHSASLAGILAPDGSFIFREVDSSGTSSGGGFSEFDSTNDTFSAFAFPDTSVSGTLNPSTFKITGNFNSPGGGSGTFSMSRSQSVTFDSPPVITSDLPASITIPLGNVLKLMLGTSGSSPLNYQWYVNSTEDPPIPGATSSTLIVSNNVLQHTGQYTIWATVNNVAGETNSRNCLVTVVAETNRPTITITTPKPGQLWSNDTFDVTGTTSDKVGITGVFYYVNNGFFTGASSSDNWAHWTAYNVPLVPGTNTIVVYTYNVGGIAATNSVKLVYIESGALTTITNGMGSITPYNSGTLLQITKKYSLTAKG